MLGHHWERAEATVVGRFVREQAVSRTPRYDYLVDVRLYGGPPERMSIQDGRANCDHPSVGDVLGVLYDRKNQHVKWDTSDTWPLDSAAGGRAGADGFASAAAVPPGTPPGAPWSEMAGFAGSVQSFSGEAASEMLDSLLGPGGAETIAAMRAQARNQGAPGRGPGRAAGPVAGPSGQRGPDRGRVRGSAPEDHQRDLTWCS